MDQKGWLKIIALILLCFLPLSQGRGLGDFGLKREDSNQIYNKTLARILVEYASAVYTMDLTELFTWTCSRCGDLTEGFEVVEIIVDVQNCLQAYVGVSPDPNAIIIVFRGTQENSIQNWIEDLFWKQLDLNYPGMPDAMVHHGFYSAYHNTTLRPAVLRAVEKTRKLKGDVPIIVVGHSMGGAMASFCALDLVVNQGMEKVKLMTFGQPRIGNAVFASYFIEQVPDTIRVTHAHDIVPHLPPYYHYFPQKTYHHFPREVWLHDVGLGSLVYLIEQICDESGEDPTCSRSVSGNSVKDHLVYLGVNMKAETWGTCRIVMDYSVLPYQMDLAGNVVLSKDMMRKESESQPIIQLDKQGSRVSGTSTI
ncbi:alpha/beta-Hydrolases superfamily protein [Rhynchospora pubera]|uniref:Alpha/beta-Hydrolases superfamily protein n=1 Tax=Rhynchospora pubera TaxID=906938 RepID=A0AAV8E9M4_9POAL|nr:alpha/beta-Hydrolases superfamily protein [Rhynchospora pubera]